jgi:hypothetical protein
MDCVNRWSRASHSKRDARDDLEGRQNTKNSELKHETKSNLNLENTSFLDVHPFKRFRLDLVSCFNSLFFVFCLPSRSSLASLFE